jgi:tubulin polyglutamylase TTLL5
VTIFKRIEDILVKTIISAEPLLNNGCEMFVPHRNNCFELLGFDVMIDDKLQAKLIEVNLSPSLSCDSALDQKVKANLLADLFSMAGIVN